ncbi:tape measure protein [Flexibacterium corallicola]|uniref:tape measure protein n=1 Tax=Flexibacterium corallicola TaxID=3037259 RepID=UPI00286F388D|nr:tape measure protein [Pseudovibrio sp. M1P-2-3]
MSSMRLGVTAELNDRVSKRLKKLMRLNEKLEKLAKVQEKLTKGQSKSQEKLARATEKTAKAQKAVSAATKATASAHGTVASGAARVHSILARSVQVASQFTSKLRASERVMARMRKGGALMKGGAGKMAKGAVVAGGTTLAAAGLATAATNMVIGPAAEMESYMVQFEALEGSAAAARKAMNWTMDFEMTTSMELPQLIEAYRQLKVFGIDPTNGSLQALVDTTAMAGGDAEYLAGVTMALGQAWSKGKLQGEEAQQMIERGIPVWDMLSKATGRSSAALMEMGSKGELGRDVIGKLVELMGTRAAGASDKMAKTWNGMMSTMSSHWWKFRNMIAEAGLFDFVKGHLGDLLATVNQMAADGSLKAWAEDISTNMISTLKSLYTFGLELWEVMKSVGAGLSFAADMLGGWNNLAMVLIALPIVSSIAGIVAGVAQLAAGLFVLGTAVMSVSWPILAIIAGVAALAGAAYLIYNNWGAVVDWFTGAWATIKNGAALAWDWFKENLSWHPLAMIANNWGSISDWFAGLWANIKGLAAQAWEGLKTLLSWHPLALIISNWDSIAQWFGNFWMGLKAKALAGWESVKAAFTGWQWPSLPAFEFPSFDSIKKKVIGFFKLDWLPAWEWPEIPLPELPDFAGMMSSVTNKVGEAWDGLTGIFSNKDPVEIAATNPTSLERATEAAGKLQTAMSGVAAVDVSPAMTKLNQLRHSVEALDFTSHGQRLMETIAAGMRSKAHVLTDAMRSAVQAVRDYLPNSPAKVGPLSDIHRLRFTQTIAQSIQPAPMVNAMRKATAATLAAATIAMPAVGAPAMAMPTMVMPPVAAPAYQAATPQIVRPSEKALAGAAASSQPASGSGGNTIHITFAPQITVGAGSGADEVAIRNILEEQRDELVAMLRQQMAEEDRLEF